MGPPTLTDGIDDTWWNNPSNTQLYKLRPRNSTREYNPNNLVNYEPSGVSFRRGNLLKSYIFNAERLEGVNVSMVDNPKGDGRAYVYLLGEKSMDVLRYNTRLR